MKKVALIVLSCIFMSFIMGCQNDKTKDTNTNTSDSSATAKKDEEVQKKIYKQNEEAFIKNKSGENIYSLTINSAKAVDVPEQYKESVPKDTKKVLVITYTYNYIKEEKSILNSLKISPLDLQVYDEKSTSINHIDLLAGEYPFNSDLLSEGINAGRSKQVYGAYSLKNDSKTIQIDMNSNINNQKLTFEIPVE